MGGKSFVLVYDVPRERQGAKRQVNRLLHRIKARKHQHSVWRHDNLKQFMEIAMFIKSNGGNASILEERFLF